MHFITIHNTLHMKINIYNNNRLIIASKTIINENN